MFPCNTSEKEQEHGLTGASANGVPEFVMMKKHHAEYNADTKIGRKDFAKVAEAASERTIISFESQSSDGVQRDLENFDEMRLCSKQESLRSVTEKTFTHQFKTNLVVELQKISLDLKSFLKLAASNILHSLVSNMQMPMKATKHKEVDEELNEDSAVRQSIDLLEPRKVFAISRTKVPLYKQESNKQLYFLRRSSTLSWANMSNRWKSNRSLLEDFPLSEEENLVKTSIHREKPIIAKAGSTWMLSENAIR